MKNLPSVKAKKYNDVTSIINAPNKKAQLQNCIDEVIRCKQNILDQNEQIKSIKEGAVDQLGIDPKIFTSLVSVVFNNNFEQKRDELEQLDLAISALMQTGAIGSDSDE